jgi:hypothetical protein
MNSNSTIFKFGPDEFHKKKCAEFINPTRK